jgi:hypothetical protein
MILAAMSGAMVAGAATAIPTYTNVRTGSESNHLTLFNSLYGGGFATTPSIAVGVDQGNGTTNNAVTVGFSNGTWEFLRTFDTGGVSPLDLQNGNFAGAQDTNWQDGVVDVRVTAKIAGDSHTFGWYNDASASGFQAITATTVGNVVNDVSLSSSFRWGLDTSNGLDLTSDGSLDNGGLDQMVTYQIMHNGAFYGWLLAWEDRVGSGADYDYNDAWLEIAVLAVIPSPLAGGMAGIGLMGLAARRRRS